MKSSIKSFAVGVALMAGTQGVEASRDYQPIQLSSEEIQRICNTIHDNSEFILSNGQNACEITSHTSNTVTQDKKKRGEKLSDSLIVNEPLLIGSTSLLLTSLFLRRRKRKLSIDKNVPPNEDDEPVDFSEFHQITDEDELDFSRFQECGFKVDGEKIESQETHPIHIDNSQEKPLDNVESIYGDGELGSVVSELELPQKTEIIEHKSAIFSPKETIDSFGEMKFWKSVTRIFSELSLDDIEGYFKADGHPNAGKSIKLPPVFPEYISASEIREKQIEAIEILEKMRSAEYEGLFRYKGEPYQGGHKLLHKDRYISGTELINAVNRYVSERNELSKKILEERSKK